MFRERQGRGSYAAVGATDSLPLKDCSRCTNVVHGREMKDSNVHDAGFHRAGFEGLKQSLNDPGSAFEFRGSRRRSAGIEGLARVALNGFTKVFVRVHEMLKQKNRPGNQLLATIRIDPPVMELPSMVEIVSDAANVSKQDLC